MSKKKILISAIVIAKNEQERIQRCLLSLSWVDEIVVVNNGSIDKTKEISMKHRAIVLTEKSEDFSHLRNIGAKKASGEWLLYVDADELVTKELAAEIKFKVYSPKSKFEVYSGYLIRRKNFYLGHEWPGEEHILRFMKKDSLKDWQGALHETALVNGEVGILNSPLFHYTHRTPEEMVTKTNQWSETEARLRFAAHHPPVVWWRFLRVMLTAFYDSYIKQRGWRAGTVGLIESMYQSFSIFITYAKLWELQMK